MADKFNTLNNMFKYISLNKTEKTDIILKRRNLYCVYACKCVKVIMFSRIKKVNDLIILSIIVILSLKKAN